MGRWFCILLLIASVIAWGLVMNNCSNGVPQNGWTTTTCTVVNVGALIGFIVGLVMVYKHWRVPMQFY